MNLDEPVGLVEEDGPAAEYELRPKTNQVCSSEDCSRTAKLNGDVLCLSFSKNLLNPSFEES